MSRIIIKQLPKNITEEKIRSLFGTRGTITDLQLKYTADGKFRQFAFIGYRSENEAQDAVKFFNNTCIQTNRIRVEVCAALGAAESQARSGKLKESKTDSKTKQSEETGREGKKEKKNKPNKLDEIIGELKDDPEFQEFLKVHDKKRTLWANDGVEATTTHRNDGADSGVERDENENETTKVPTSHEDNKSDDDQESDEIDESNDGKKLADKPISDLDYMKSLMAGSNTKSNKQDANNQTNKKKKKEEIENLYTIKIHNVPYNVKRQTILHFFKPLKPYSVRLPSKVHGFCYVGFKTEKDMTKAMLKHKSFINGKQVFFADFTERNKLTKANKLADGKSNNNADGKNANAATNVNPKWQKQMDAVANEEGIAESGSIFFRNLAYTVTEDDLQKVFEPFGPVAEIQLPVDSITRQIKGYGTVTFVMPEHAVQAFNKLDGVDFHGRLLHLIPAKSKTNDDADGGGEGDAGLSFKQKKAQKLKSTAQQSLNWNTLFLGANAVADIMAQQYETSKEHILDTSKGGSTAAVRIALGETRIVMEMKKFLEEQGVRLSAFDAAGGAAAKSKRSKHIILVKNLPSGTTVPELTTLFSKYGPLARLVLPTSGVTAIVEYCDSNEARKAFKALAYSKFKHMPLFLEWAPEHCFTTTASGEPIKCEVQESTENDSNNKDEKVKEEPKEEGDDDDAENDDEPPEPQTTLFLHNLNNKTEEPTIREHFKHLGAIHTVEIAKRKDAQNPRLSTSLGYGFIQFKRAATANIALKRMQATTIDGYTVELKRSDRILKSAAVDNQHIRKATAKHKPSTKILLRNIPFQAKANEVRDLFKAFGEIRSLRLPLKATPGETTTHRGFGFIDFMTKSDAKKAFTALSQSTHLYGRRLVLEWAATDQESETVDALRKRTASTFVGGNASSAGKRSKKGFFDVDLHMETANNANSAAAVVDHDDDDEMDI